MSEALCVGSGKWLPSPEVIRNLGEVQHPLHVPVFPITMEGTSTTHRLWDPPLTGWSGLVGVLALVQITSSRTARWTRHVQSCCFACAQLCLLPPAQMLAAGNLVLPCSWIEVGDSLERTIHICYRGSWRWSTPNLCFVEWVTSLCGWTLIRFFSSLAPLPSTPKCYMLAHFCYIDTVSVILSPQNSTVGK